MMAVDVHRARGLKTSIGRRRPFSSSDRRIVAGIKTRLDSALICLRSQPTDLKVESEKFSCSSRYN